MSHAGSSSFMCMAQQHKCLFFTFKTYKQYTNLRECVQDSVTKIWLLGYIILIYLLTFFSFNEDIKMYLQVQE